MSKIGVMPITIPQGVSLEVTDSIVRVKGPKGTLEQPMIRGIQVAVEENEITLERKNENWKVKAAHGLMRALIANMVQGVTNGWQKELELVGTGYRARLEGKNLILNVGYSHSITIEPPQGVDFALEGQTNITVKGINKQVVGQTAATIRSKRPPEPYKGKGVRYKDEKIRRKAGKAAKAA